MRRTFLTLMVASLCSLLCSSCTYLKYSRAQAQYRKLQQLSPSQRNLKHLIDRQNFAIIGAIRDPDDVVPDDAAMVLAAFSNRFEPHELVAANHSVRDDGHFGLDLPEGDYDIIAFFDRNGDRRFDSTEAVSRTRLNLFKTDLPSMVVVSQDMKLSSSARVEWDVDLPVLDNAEREESLFFPVGTLRSLDDPIFSRDVATLGQYDPAAFLELSPTTFFALEDELSHKSPVIFVHGISGTPREFQSIVDSLDRSRFKPWFFYYPSGADLGQMGKLFHDIFLSRTAINIDKGTPIVIVAHSMGGLVVREALNMRRGDASTSSPIEFISLASPLGGHPSARLAGFGGGMVLPSWRDLNPESNFIDALYRKPLPVDVRHHLFFAYRDGDGTDLEGGSDGVVPLQSQLHGPARQQAIELAGFQADHAGILHHPQVIAQLQDILSTVRIDAPENHAAYLLKGGYEVEADSTYSPRERYLLLHYGEYLRALASGDIEPANDWQRKLVPMLRRQVKPEFEAAQAWLKFETWEASQASRQ